MSRTTFHCERGLGPAIEAVALVSPYTFSPRYDLDRENGIISRAGHPCYGESIADKILICPGVQGGIAGGWAFLMMRGRGVGFAGLVFGEVNPVMVQGAVAAGIPLMAGVERDIFDAVRSGQRIRINPQNLTIVLEET